MSSDIQATVIIAPKPGKVLDKDAINKVFNEEFSEYFSIDDHNVSTSGLARIEIDDHVSAFFDFHKVCNNIHEASDTVDSVVAIEVTSIYGRFCYYASTDTPEDKVKEISRDFAQGIIANVHDTITWAKAE